MIDLDDSPRRTYRLLPLGCRNFFSVQSVPVLLALSPGPGAAHYYAVKCPRTPKENKGIPASGSRSPPGQGKGSLLSSFVPWPSAFVSDTTTDVSVTAAAAGGGGRGSMVTRSMSSKAVGPAAFFAAIVLAAGSAKASPLLEEAVGPPPGGGGAPSPKAGGPRYTTLLSDVSTAFTTFQAGKYPSLGHHRSVSARPASSFRCFHQILLSDACVKIRRRQQNRPCSRAVPCRGCRAPDHAVQPLLRSYGVPVRILCCEWGLES